MVLFSISCETCTARLNVKQEAAIGQVLACPKCGSMVHIEPPEGWEPPAAAPLPPLPTRPRDVNDSQATLSSEFDDLDSVLARTRSVANPAARTRTKPAPRPQAAAPVAEDGPVMPDASWTSDAAKGRSKAVAWTAGIVGVCLLALVLVTWLVTQMIGGGAEPETPEQVAQVDSDKTANPDEVDDKNSELENTGNDADAKQPTDPEAADTDKGKEADVAVPPLDPGEPGNDDAAENPPESDKSGDPATPEEDTSDAPDDPPIDVDAALDNPGAMEVSSATGNDSLVEGMGEMRDLLFEPGVNLNDLRDFSTDPQDNLIGIGKVYVPRPDPLDIDPVAALDEMFPGIAYTEIPLVGFIRNFNRLTRIPIQLDTDSVIAGQLDPHASITVTVENSTAKDFLQAALDTHDLVWQWNDDSQVIVVLPQGHDELSRHEFPVDPALASNEEQASEIIELVKRVIQPESWNTADGEGSISIADGKCVVEQTGKTARQVEMLLQLLNAAAKIKDDPDSAELQAQLATLYSRNEALGTSESAWEDIQLDVMSRVLDQIARHDGVTVLVNWNELLQHGWNPNTQVPWKSRDQKIEKTLMELTSSMGIGWRMLDEGTLEITSRQQLWNGTRIEVYPCHRQLARNYTPEQIIRFLQSGIAGDLPKQAWTRVEFLPRLGCIVTLLPDPLHIRAEKILNQLAGE